jgi:hypothetical protein
MSDDPMRIGPYHHMDLVSEPGMIVLRREDGTEVATFSVWGTTLEEIERAAEEDYYDECGSA